MPKSVHAGFTVITVEDYEEMSMVAAKFIIDKVKNNSKLTLGLSTGGTPKKVYENLILDHRKNQTSYKGVTTFNLDEYVGLADTHPNSYHYYMLHRLFKHIDIPDHQCHIPSGLVNDIEEECAKYEKIIYSVGGIYLQILGLGENGHIGFNEPGTSFSKRTHVTTLTNETRLANSRYFNRVEEVPKQAITMGIETILSSQQILLLVSGEKKAKALDACINGELDEDIPCTALQKHHKVTIVADKEALH